MKQMYTTLATSETPALILFLLDVSASMERTMGNKRRLDVALQSLRQAADAMIFRSTKGKLISPRYHIGVLAYSTEVVDVLDGIHPVDKARGLLEERLEQIVTQQGTDTAKAFYWTARILRESLHKAYFSPAPLIVHLTDGEYTGDDPAPFAYWLKRLRVADGYVLIQNIYISDVFAGEIRDFKTWKGIQENTPLQDNYARKLREMSSLIPDSYLQYLREFMGSQLLPHSYMLFPGHTPEFIRYGFQMSAATGMQGIFFEGR